MEQKSPGWKISELYEKSWQIVKQNKVLWLFGMASAAFGLGNGGGSGNFDSLTKLFQRENQPPAEKISQVMGVSTDLFSQALTNIFLSVPVWLYALLGLGIVLFILTGIILNVIYQSWVSGALITGTNLASTGQKPSIAQCSAPALSSLKSLVWLSVIPQLIFFLVVITFFVILILVMSFIPDTVKIIPIVLMIVGAVVSLVGLLLLDLTQIWAPRRVVIEKKGGRESFSSSFKVARRRFWKMLGLGAINMILSTIVMMVLVLPILAIVGVWVFGSITGNNFMPSLPVLIVVGVIAAITFMVLAPLLSGIINVFKASVWTLAYQAVKGEFNE